jgi:hypothetical protein
VEEGANMSDEVKLVVDPIRQMRIGKVKDVTKLTQEEITTFVDMVSRAYQAKKPAKEDLQAIRVFLKDYPEMCKAVFTLVDSTQTLIINNLIGGYEVAEIAVEEYIVKIRDDMGYHDAPMMEQLLIENIVTCWLHVQYCQGQIAMLIGKDRSIAILEFWEKRNTAAQRRYLAACESLAKVRKLRIPNIQMNFGEKQINVAGNLAAGTPGTPKQEEVIDA